MTEKGDEREGLKEGEEEEGGRGSIPRAPEHPLSGTVFVV